MAFTLWPTQVFASDGKLVTKQPHTAAILLPFSTTHFEPFANQ